MEYFDYSIPKSSELYEEIQAPYRFSKELRDYTDYVFSHATLNDRGKFYDTHKTDFSSNDMLKAAYRSVLYYLKYPNQFAGSMDNIIPSMAVMMWKTFIAYAKASGHVDKYIPTPIKVVPLLKNKFMDMLLDEIKHKKFYMHPSELRRVENPKDRYTTDKLRLNRDNVHASAKMPLDEGDPYFELLCGYD